MRTPSICFVGLENLPLLAPEFGRFRVGGAELQQTLLATTLARRGFRVSMVVEDLGQPDGASWRGVETFKAYANSDGIPVLRFVHPRWTGLWAAMKRANADLYYVSCAGALVGQVASFVRVHGRKGPPASGIVWRPGLIVTSRCAPPGLAAQTGDWAIASRVKRLCQAIELKGLCPPPSEVGHGA